MNQRSSSIQFNHFLHRPIAWAQLTPAFKVRDSKALRSMDGSFNYNRELMVLKSNKKYLFASAFLFLGLNLLSGCAILHHAQIGQVDGRKDSAHIPFEIKVSEVGVSLDDASVIARSTNSRGGDQLADAAAIISLFQFGPRTGAPVYDQRYAEKIIYQIYEKCPSGRVTGLMSVREMRKYPVISGEIVKITGYCLRSRNPASEAGDADDEITAALLAPPNLANKE